MTTSLALLGTSSATEVDVSTDSALFGELRPAAIGALGYYQQAFNTGAIAATLASGATVASLRWTDSTHLCLVRRVTAIGMVLTTITTALRFDLQLFVARGFTASDSAATDVTPASTMNKLRTSMGSTLLTSGNLRVASTVAVTAGTRILDTNPIGRLLAWSGTAAGTFIYGGLGGRAPLWDRTQIGMSPLILAQNEGIVLTTSAAGPATGTFTIGFEIEWQEVSAY